MVRSIRNRTREVPAGQSLTRPCTAHTYRDGFKLCAAQRCRSEVGKNVGGFPQVVVAVEDTPISSKIGGMTQSPRVRYVMGVSKPDIAGDIKFLKGTPTQEPDSVPARTSGDVRA